MTTWEKKSSEISLAIKEQPMDLEHVNAKRNTAEESDDVDTQRPSGCRVELRSSSLWLNEGPQKMEGRRAGPLSHH